ncbi:MAG TPA: hypothetical protein PK890_06590, partial [Terrimesophilobacter sp.]|nr:hypothetical protein [Terrimesophilobacter sp.]
MKTTFDLPEWLVADIKKLARSRGTTARDIVQQSLTRTLREEESDQPFTLRDMSTPGWASRHPEFRDVPLHDLVLLS